MLRGNFFQYCAHICNEKRSKPYIRLCIGVDLTKLDMQAHHSSAKTKLMRTHSHATPII